MDSTKHIQVLKLRICYQNVNSCQISFHSCTEMCHQNNSKSDKYRRHCTKYTLQLDSYKGTFGLPPEFDAEPFPNFGPKVNHHFTANNSAFVETEHPRWGLIQSITPQRSLRNGEELFAYYRYERQDFPADHLWYWEIKKKLKCDEK